MASATPRRKGCLAPLLGLGALVIIALGAYFFLLQQLRLAVQRRCEAALDGAKCTIDHIELRADGAVAHGVHVQAKAGLVSGDIEQIVALFDWKKALKRQQQGVVVRIARPVLNNEIPIGEVLVQLRKMTEGVLPDNTPSNVRLERLVIEKGEVEARITLLADVGVRGITADWKRGGNVELRWEEATFSTILEEDSTGPCSVTKPDKKSIATVTCGARKLDVDLGKLRSIADLVHVLMQPKKK
jgi:hypothetical protein